MVIGGLTAVVGCEAAPAVARGRAAPVATASSESGPRVMFPVRPAESDHIAAALRIFAERRPDHDVREARLYRFSIDSTAGRYILLAPMSGSDSRDMRSWGLSFSTIVSGDPPEISRPFGFGGLEFIDVQAVRDIDRDGAADVVFCTGYEGQDEPSLPRALGYRGGAWYEISLPAATDRRLVRGIACDASNGKAGTSSSPDRVPPRDLPGAPLQR